ncbi:MAG: hypothetical protein L0Z62_16090 [Gemmataceae bacterium]|nr:hypothetical protein [Gemmataceae bacterium]
MVLLCRSCVVGVEVSFTASGTQAKCPYCGGVIGEGNSQPAPTDAQRTPSRQRVAVVMSVFVACLALPVALCLLLLSADGEPEQVHRADPRVAQNHQPPASGRDSSRPGRGLIDSQKAPSDLGSLPFQVTVLAGSTHETTPPPAGQPAELMPQGLPPVLVQPGQGALADKAGASNPQDGSSSASSQDKGGNFLDPKAATKPGMAGLPLPPIGQPLAKGPIQQGGFVGQRPAQRVTFLGSVAEGGRFCIIADRSASMRGNPLETVKVEMVRTLRSIGPDNRFFVTFFNTQAFAQPGQRWLPGGAGVPAVLPWIGSMRGEGNTNPTPAFELALKWLAPQPDAIFFMTDGVFDSKVATQVALLNQRVPRIPIHTILFVHQKAAPGRAIVSPPPLPRPGSPRPPAGPRVAQQPPVNRAQELQQIQAAAVLLQRIALESGGSFRAVMAPPNPPGR